jgi:glycerophosphoryl diester phosphodiesterase
VRKIGNTGKRALQITLSTWRTAANALLRMTPAPAQVKLLPSAPPETGLNFQMAKGAMFAILVRSRRWIRVAGGSMKQGIAMALLCAFLQAQAFDLQGHRGARGLAPENTLPGFALALARGVSTLETDIAISRDGVLVISHDPALNPDITRGPDGQFLAARGPLIWHTEFAELQRYDVGRLKPGTRYAAQYPAQQPSDGARLPKLEDLFALVRKSGNTQVRLALETKLTPAAPDETMAPEPFARALVDAVLKAGMASRTTILSFDWRTLQAVQKMAPEIGTVYLTIQQRNFDNIGASRPGTSPWTAGFSFAEHGSVPRLIRAAGGRIWSSFHGDLDAAKVKEAQSLGLTVLAWTVNEPAQIARIMDMGVDGIVTDRPDLVRDEMQRRGMLLPAPTPTTP